MKTLMLVLGTGLALSACSDGYYGPGPGGPVAYDAYYDGAYGPFYDGYWGPNGVFYYSRGPRHRYIPDRGHHFMRDHAGAPGSFRPVRGPGYFRGGPGWQGHRGRPR